MEDTALAPILDSFFHWLRLTPEEYAAGRTIWRNICSPNGAL